MELVEIRDLEGPNVFGFEPLIKVEFAVREDDRIPPVIRTRLSEMFRVEVPEDSLDAFEVMVAEFHRRIGEKSPVFGRRLVDTPDHVVVYYPWSFSTFASGSAKAAFLMITDVNYPDPTERLRAALERDRQQDNRPLWIRDHERTMPIIGITGTNGKTTTTRLLAHIFMNAGYSAGWTSTSGVYINGECVLEGDYTGPSGARRVLREPGLEIALLETARGGILLRGAAYESNDVGVFLNVSADHLSLQGVETLDTLADVKSVVVRVTKPGGLVVLNADDPRVLAQINHVRADVLLFSQNQVSEAIAVHRRSGKKAIVAGDDRLVMMSGLERPVEIARFDDVPMTYSGAARHMVENAMAAAGAALGLGLSVDQIAAGLKTFRSDSEHNLGRLNVFSVDHRIVVVDYAHNEDGLRALIEISKSLLNAKGRLHLVAGTAGDRQDEILVAIGRLAGSESDRIYLKDNPHYRRGRAPGETMEVMERGVAEACALDRLASHFPNELSAFEAALGDSEPCDLIAIMCQEDQARIFADLRKRGAVER